MKGTIHLPEQAKLHGPLHKRNEYVGENCFKEIGLNYRKTKKRENRREENTILNALKT